MQHPELHEEIAAVTGMRVVAVGVNNLTKTVATICDDGRQYCVWNYNTIDKACFWGHYYSYSDDAFEEAALSLKEKVNA